MSTAMDTDLPWAWQVQKHSIRLAMQCLREAKLLNVTVLQADDFC